MYVLTNGTVVYGVMAPWLRFLEAYLVQVLLRTPAFHRAVEKVARQVHRLRHGLPPEELGGTKISQPSGSPGFLRHFLDEVKTQMGQAEGKAGGGGGGGSAGVPVDSRATGHQGAKSAGEMEAMRADEESADAAWRESVQRREFDGQGEGRKGLLGEYVEALRQQVRGDKKA